MYDRPQIGLNGPYRYIQVCSEDHWFCSFFSQRGIEFIREWAVTAGPLWFQIPKLKTRPKTMSTDCGSCAHERHLVHTAPVVGLSMLISRLGRTKSTNIKEINRWLIK